MTGVLRGFDPFMNLVLDEAVEEVSAQEKHNIGMVVSKDYKSSYPAGLSLRAVTCNICYSLVCLMGPQCYG